MKVVKLPEMNYEGLTADEALLKFFCDLGWDTKRYYLDPKKVKVSEQDHLTLSSILKSLNAAEAEKINLLLLDYGPSCGYEQVNNGYVKLYDGWITASQPA